MFWSHGKHVFDDLFRHVKHLAFSCNVAYVTEISMPSAEKLNCLLEKQTNSVFNIFSSEKFCGLCCRVACMARNFWKVKIRDLTTRPAANQERLMLRYMLSCVIPKELLQVLLDFSWQVGRHIGRLIKMWKCLCCLPE